MGNEQPRYLIGRYYDLLVSRSRLQTGTTGKLDIDAAFQAAIGIGIDEFIGLTTLYAAPFYVQSVSDLVTLHFQNIISKIEEQIRAPVMRAQCQRLLSRDIPSFRTSFLADTQDLALSSYLPFQETPLVRTEIGSALPISLRFLLDKISLGIYWILHEYLKRLDPE